MGDSIRYDVSLWFYELALALRELSKNNGKFKDKVAARVRSRLRGIVGMYDESPYDAVLFMLSKADLDFVEEHIVDILHCSEKDSCKSIMLGINESDFEKLVFTVILSILLKVYIGGELGSINKKEDVAPTIKDLLSDLSSANPFLRELLESSLVDAKRISEALLPSQEV
ncbi:MAG: hypothetical protein LRS47_03395 [Desulfurococcales archaeon]|nr:hypothetical protein [Desulfurococcales archaeon]